MTANDHGANAQDRWDCDDPPHSEIADAPTFDDQRQEVAHRIRYGAISEVGEAQKQYAEIHQPSPDTQPTMDCFDRGALSPHSCFEPCAVLGRQPRGVSWPVGQQTQDNAAKQDGWYSLEQKQPLPSRQSKDAVELEQAGRHWAA